MSKRERYPFNSWMVYVWRDRVKEARSAQGQVGMASGAIVGECPVCNDLVWEDEWRIFDDIVMHTRFVPDYFKRRHGMKESQFLRLCRAQETRQAIQDTQASLKDCMDFYDEKLQDIKGQLERLEKFKVKRDK